MTAIGPMETLLRTAGAGGLPGIRGLDARACADILGVDGVSVSVTRDGDPAELVWSSGALATALEEAQYTVGEGPSQDARVSRSIVVEPDLADVPAARWPAFGPLADELGVRALFAYPLRVGTILMGTLVCVRSLPGPLTAVQAGDVLLLLEALTVRLLGDAADERGDGMWLQHDEFLHRAEVHQATGMLVVQLGVGPAEALLRLRAYAWRHNRSVAEVGRLVVARELRFERDEERS